MANIYDQDVIQAKSDYYLLCHIARLVNEGFFADGGRIRGVPVIIGGSNYKPPLPVESIVKEQIDRILSSGKAAFYEGEELNIVSDFLKKNCWKTF